MKEIKPAFFLRTGLLFYFLIPYFIFLTYYNFSFVSIYSELLWTIKNSILQSGLTALFAVALSVPMSQGLFLLPLRWQQWLVQLLTVPQILPALYSILLAFTILNPFPMGSFGIIILFVFINLGFATLLIYSVTREKLGNLSMLSEVYSIGRLKFLYKIYFPIIRSDLLNNYLIIFIFCFTSFSIPLIAGGGRGTNIEVLIYEKIFVEQNFAAAFGLCLFQAIVIFFLSFFILRSKKKPEANEFNSGNYLKSYVGLVLIGCYLVLYFGGYLFGLLKSFAYFDFIIEYKSELIAATLFTTEVLFYYLVLNFTILILWLVDYLENLKFNLAVNLLSVSTMLVGFSLYLFFPLSKKYDMIKIVFAMSVLFFPTLFKLFLQPSIESLQQQILISKMYGLSRATIIIEIILKQIAAKIYLWLSLLIIWFISEFAILKALGVQTQTLGLLSEGFLSSYRLSLSYLMSFYILIYWLCAMFVVYLSLKGAYVVYKKFNF